ncbi:hypothetical protein BGX21_007285 [Mortierella sp. AD011]|nr:hypothetical protein BGX20_001281 [Mortierella sp. AD010]KAF9398787.1 hypothetical protein BGX21_007285 [Mortierella sp. AD011]
MQRAPNLSMLHLQPVCQSPFPQAEYRQAISNQAFKKLLRLRISQHVLDDEDIAMTIDAMTEAKYLEFYQGNFSKELVLIADVEPFFYYSNIEHPQKCEYNRRHDPGDTIKVAVTHDIYGRHYPRPYTFDMSSEDSIVDKSNPEGLTRLHRQQQLEQEQAFRQQFRLTRLRGLGISDPDGRRQSLKLRLKSHGGELDQLESLKRLDWIQFGNTFRDLSENELDWMKGHWPKFVGLQGKYHEYESQHHKLKEYWSAKLKGRVKSVK